MGEEVGGVGLGLHRAALIRVLERGGHGFGIDVAGGFGEVEFFQSPHGVGGGLALHDAREAVADAHGADRAAAGGGDEVAVEPAVGVDGVSGDAGLPGVLLLEVGAGVFVVADGVGGGAEAGIKEGFEGGHARVEAEEAVEVDEGVGVACVGGGGADAAAEGGVVLVAVGRDEVEAVGPAAQEEGDEDFVLGDGLGRDGTGDGGKEGADAHVGDDEAGGFEEVAAGQMHGRPFKQIHR